MNSRASRKESRDISTEDNSLALSSSPISKDHTKERKSDPVENKQLKQFPRVGSQEISATTTTTINSPPSCYPSKKKSSSQIFTDYEIDLPFIIRDSRTNSNRQQLGKNFSTNSINAKSHFKELQISNPRNSTPMNPFKVHPFSLDLMQKDISTVMVDDKQVNKNINEDTSSEKHLQDRSLAYLGKKWKFDIEAASSSNINSIIASSNTDFENYNSSTGNFENEETNDTSYLKYVTAKELKTPTTDTKGSLLTELNVVESDEIKFGGTSANQCTENTSSNFEWSQVQTRIDFSPPSASPSSHGNLNYSILSNSEIRFDDSDSELNSLRKEFDLESISDGDFDGDLIYDELSDILNNTSSPEEKTFFCTPEAEPIIRKSQISTGQLKEHIGYKSFYDSNISTYVQTSSSLGKEHVTDAGFEKKCESLHFDKDIFCEETSGTFKSESPKANISVFHEFDLPVTKTEASITGPVDWIKNETFGNNIFKKELNTSDKSSTNENNEVSNLCDYDTAMMNIQISLFEDKVQKIDTNLNKDSTYEDMLNVTIKLSPENNETRPHGMKKQDLAIKQGDASVDKIPEELCCVINNSSPKRKHNLWALLQPNSLGIALNSSETEEQDLAITQEEKISVDKIPEDLCCVINNSSPKRKHNLYGLLEPNSLGITLKSETEKQDLALTREPKTSVDKIPEELYGVINNSSPKREHNLWGLLQPNSPGITLNSSETLLQSNKLEDNLIDSVVNSTFKTLHSTVDERVLNEANFHSLLNYSQSFKISEAHNNSNFVESPTRNALQETPLCVGMANSDKVKIEVQSDNLKTENGSLSLSVDHQKFASGNADNNYISINKEFKLENLQIKQENLSSSENLKIFKTETIESDKETTDRSWILYINKGNTTDNHFNTNSQDPVYDMMDTHNSSHNQVNILNYLESGSSLITGSDFNSKSSVEERKQYPHENIQSLLQELSDIDKNVAKAVLKAITDLRRKNGVTQSQILKHIKQHKTVPLQPTLTQDVQRFLKSASEAGIIKQKEFKFVLSDQIKDLSSSQNKTKKSAPTEQKKRVTTPISKRMATLKTAAALTPRHTPKLLSTKLTQLISGTPSNVSQVFKTLRSRVILRKNN